MSRCDPLPSFAAIVVAAGKGIRAGQRVPKQFADWRGKPVVAHSVGALVAAGADPVVVAIPRGTEMQAMTALRDFGKVRFVTGGATRQESVAAALDSLAEDAPERVLIHDAARPDLPQEVIARLLVSLDQHPGAIPTLPVVDSLAIERDGVMAGSADRETLRRVQTPQAFRYEAIHSAHRAWQGEPTAGDDAQVLAAHGGKVALVVGSEALRKLTFAEDFHD
ncbi:2-C-methyl-D-erythritol 4-phosphate cytidylyltransferase [Erythrobacter sp. SDW2]|nr:2-C-methyl-D-erythritol 4-phosphate cytidylyltransferase [Erythrobacter sp. SDW2]